MAATRKGKFLCLRFEGDCHLIAHLRMTGAFYQRGAADPLLPHTHVELDLGEGRLLSYRDPRRFGRLWWVEGQDPFVKPPLLGLGVDALEIGEGDFLALLKGRRKRIKAFLLDQSLIAGVGNIYADEALFRARLHPEYPSDRIPRARGRELYENLGRVLRASIASGGSSIRDYVDAEGNAGSFQDQHLVYGKEGLACPRCGRPLRKMVVAQRGTHYCATCQRRPRL
jgi:formamidopyrimidine-DNA glycosylase